MNSSQVDRIEELLDFMKEDSQYSEDDIKLVRNVLSVPTTPWKTISVESGDEVVERLIEVLGVKNANRLSNILKIAPASIQNIRKKNSVPMNWIGKLVMQFGVNPFYILYGGENKKYLSGSDNPGLMRVK